MMIVLSRFINYLNVPLSVDVFKFSHCAPLLTIYSYMGNRLSQAPQYGKENEAVKV